MPWHVRLYRRNACLRDLKLLLETVGFHLEKLQKMNMSGSRTPYPCAVNTCLWTDFQRSYIPTQLFVKQTLKKFRKVSLWLQIGLSSKKRDALRLSQRVARLFLLLLNKEHFDFGKRVAL